MRTYSLPAASRILGVKENSLKCYVNSGRIRARPTHHGLRFARGELDRYLHRHSARRLALGTRDGPKNFDSVYGKGSYERLLALLATESFAATGRGYGVERETVRQWYEQIPEKERPPRPVRDKKPLGWGKFFENNGISAFCRAALRYFPASLIRPVIVNSRYARTDIIMLGGEPVYLRKMTEFSDGRYAGYVYQCELNCGRKPKYVFCWNDDMEYLFLSRSEAPEILQFVDSGASRYEKNHNNFNAFKRSAKHGRKAA